MSTGKVILGVAAGLAAGAILGVLFAPDKGSVTRKKIAKKSEEISDDAKEKLEEIVETISEKYNAAKQGAASLLDKGKTKFEEVKTSLS